jgi:hypothetical protein
MAASLGPIGSSVELCKEKLRKDGAIVELTVDKSSARAAVTRELERGKLKNLHY